MSQEKKQRNILARISLRAAKLPALYLILGILLIALSYIDDIFPLTNWKNLFEITDKAGNICLALAFITFVYTFLVLLCRRTERKLADKHKVASLIMASIRKGSRIIFLLLIINVIITIAAPTKSYLTLANNIINAIIIGSIGWIVIQIFYTFEAVLFQYMNTLTNEAQLRVKALYTKMHIIRNIATVVIATITIAAILMTFNSVRNIGISLLASAGFLTAIVGLSAQKTLVSLFSGLQIALAQPIKIGDIVVIEKESGIIEEITFTYVTLKLGDRRRLMVPINYFIEKPFENWSHEGNSLRSSFHFHVDFMMPIEPLRAEFENILRDSCFWDGVAKKLQVAHMNDHSVEIRVQISAANADNLSDLRAEVREKMLAFMQTHYAQFFPNQRRMQIKQSDTEIG